MSAPGTKVAMEAEDRLSSSSQQSDTSTAEPAAKRQKVADPINETRFRSPDPKADESDASVSDSDTSSSPISPTQAPLPLLSSHDSRPLSEPPVFLYNTLYEDILEGQKDWIKVRGITSPATKTGCLDLNLQLEVLDVYKDWTATVRRESRWEDEEAFYTGLLENIEQDFAETQEELAGFVKEKGLEATVPHPSKLVLVQGDERKVHARRRFDIMVSEALSRKSDWEDRMARS